MASLAPYLSRRILRNTAPFWFSNFPSSWLFLCKCDKCSFLEIVSEPTSLLFFLLYWMVVEETRIPSFCGRGGGGLGNEFTFKPVSSLRPKQNSRTCASAVSHDRSSCMFNLVYSKGILQISGGKIDF